MQESVENASAKREAEIASAMHFLNSALGAGTSYDPTRPDHGRASVRAALVGVIRLIGVLFPNTPALPISLNRLLYALHDLDRGKVAPLSSPPLHPKTRGCRLPRNCSERSRLQQSHASSSKALSAPTRRNRSLGSSPVWAIGVTLVGRSRRAKSPSGAKK